MSGDESKAFKPPPPYDLEKLEKCLLLADVKKKCGDDLGFYEDIVTLFRHAEVEGRNFTLSAKVM